MTEAPKTAKQIIFSLPFRFKKEKSAEANYQTTFHFQIDGENGGEFTVNIDGGEISVKEGLEGEAKCTVKTKDSTYEDVEWERENAQMAFMWGKVKVNNITEMIAFSGMFRTVKKAFHL